jgi:hypothetical protein
MGNLPPPAARHICKTTPNPKPNFGSNGIAAGLGGLKARDVIAQGNAPGLDDKIHKP